jgi:hypothetical protein
MLLAVDQGKNDKRAIPFPSCPLPDQRALRFMPGIMNRNIGDSFPNNPESRRFPKGIHHDREVLLRKATGIPHRQPGILRVINIHGPPVGPQVLNSGGHHLRQHLLQAGAGEKVVENIRTTGENTRQSLW